MKSAAVTITIGLLMIGCYDPTIKYEDCTFHNGEIVKANL